MFIKTAIKSVWIIYDEGTSLLFNTWLERETNEVLLFSAAFDDDHEKGQELYHRHSIVITCSCCCLWSWLYFRYFIPSIRTMKWKKKKVQRHCVGKKQFAIRNEFSSTKLPSIWVYYENDEDELDRKSTTGSFNGHFNRSSMTFIPLPFFCFIHLSFVFIVTFCCHGFEKCMQNLWKLISFSFRYPFSLWFHMQSIVYVFLSYFSCCWSHSLGIKSQFQLQVSRTLSRLQNDMFKSIFFLFLSMRVCHVTEQSFTGTEQRYLSFKHFRGFLFFADDD